MANYIYDLVQQCINTSSKINLKNPSTRYLKELDKQLSDLFDLIKNEYPVYYEACKFYKDKFTDDRRRRGVEIDCILSLLEKEEKGKNRRKIFISHSSKDKTIIENFTNYILRLGMGILPEDIFCTSITGMNIRTGEEIRKHIKENVKFCDYVFLMISKNYNESFVCLNEMGAAWVMEKQVKPFLLPGTTAKDLSWIYETNIASKIEERATLDSLYEELCKRYSFTRDAVNWGKQVEKFLETCKV